MKINYTIVDSMLGRMLVAATAKGLCAVSFGQDGALVDELTALYPAALVERDDALLAAQANALLGYLAGESATPALPLDVTGDEFQSRVWAALQTIPAGETRGYGQIAAQIGAPRAARDVAAACAANPLAVVVPCHRVIKVDGTLGGYRWGYNRKRALLKREQLAQPVLAPVMS